MDARQTTITRKRYDRQAWIYDVQEGPMEFAFSRLRKGLWPGVRGRLVLEVGIGTGKNLPHHPAGARMVGIDISPRMLERAARKARRMGRDIDLVLADAQQLPFRDGCFEASAATFVFCSVPDPVAGLREVRRVTAPAGEVHLLEHVRGRGLLGRLMDLANPLVVWISGANINRDTVGNVARAGIEGADVESRLLGIVKLIRGRPGKAAAEEVTENVALR